MESERVEDEYETTTILTIKSIDDYRWINISKYKNLKELICQGMDLTILPNDLPSSIQISRLPQESTTIIT